MKTFTIDAENNITAYASPEEASAASTTPLDTFSSEKELARLAAAWPAERPNEIYNSLPGVVATKFKTQKVAIAQIWKGIQRLGEPPASKAAATKATPEPKKPRVAPAKRKATEKVTAAKKARNGAKSAKKAESSGGGGKKAEVILLMRHKGGCTLAEIMKATGWQKHTVRGFVSILGSKGGLTVESTKNDSGERTYSLPR